MDQHEIDDFKMEEKIQDKNSSRLDKKCIIYNNIYKNNDIFSSDFIFLPSIFDNINKEDDIIELLIYKLGLLCKGEDINYIKNIDKIENTENNNGITSWEEYEGIDDD